MRSIYWTMPMVVVEDEDEDEKNMIPETKKTPERALVPGT